MTDLSTKALSIACSRCGARIGEMCDWANLGRISDAFHLRRIIEGSKLPVDEDCEISDYTKCPACGEPVIRYKYLCGHIALPSRGALIQSGRNAGARASASSDGWIEIKEGCEMPDLDAENCCMDESDYGRFSNIVLVFDEDQAEILRAFLDKDEWRDASNEDTLHGVTHWMHMPAPPTDQGSRNA